MASSCSPDLSERLCCWVFPLLCPLHSLSDSLPGLPDANSQPPLSRSPCLYCHWEVTGGSHLTWLPKSVPQPQRLMPSPPTKSGVLASAFFLPTSHPTATPGPDSTHFSPLCSHIGPATFFSWIYSKSLLTGSWASTLALPTHTSTCLSSMWQPKGSCENASPHMPPLCSKPSHGSHGTQRPCDLALASFQLCLPPPFLSCTAPRALQVCSVLGLSSFHHSLHCFSLTSLSSSGPLSQDIICEHISLLLFSPKGA